ncbi:MAG: hypothetical protein TU36_003630 [Vulcanisaeta sp. AZ3]|jgi:hypothetical protein
MARWIGVVLIVLGIILAVVWYFTPLFTASSGKVYAQELVLMGVNIYFMGKHYALIPLYLPIASVAFIIASGVPVLIKDRWTYRSYSLLLALLGLVLTISSIIWQLRFLSTKGYTATPVPNGYFYMALPMTYIIGSPLYLIIAAVVLTIINLFIPAGVRRTLIDDVLNMADAEGPVKAMALAFDKLKIPYVVRDGKLYVGDTEIVSEGARLDEDSVRLAIAKGILVFSRELEVSGDEE